VSTLAPHLAEPPTGCTNSVRLPAPVLGRLVDTTTRLNVEGLKAFGLLLAEPGTPFDVRDVVFCDPRKNRRNAPAFLPAFHAQGEYFRAYDDAGFVADATDLLDITRAAEARGLEIVAPFHAHRRQPANFSLIDYRLHNPAFPWHLIVSVRDPAEPTLAAFGVDKDDDQFGIGADDGREGSQLPYEGPEVRPLRIAVQRPA
jgi:proteasome lid subunit RPN8/RPN11